jgi:hypothetical protein
MLKPTATINNWSVIQGVISRNFEELQSGNRLLGYVRGHANFPDSKLVCTSPIIDVDLSRGIVETAHTSYRLGDASDEYKYWKRERRATAA